jgi:hypothetical protein
MRHEEERDQRARVAMNEVAPSPIDEWTPRRVSDHWPCEAGARPTGRQQRAAAASEGPDELRLQSATGDDNVKYVMK